MADRRYNRAQLLRLAGVGAGAAVAGPMLRAGSADAAVGARVPLKVGVLVPSGASYPHMGENLLAGLALALPGCSLVTRRVELGYGGAHSSAKDLLDAGVDVVVAGVSAPVAQQLAPLFHERRTPLVVANVGAHVVRPEQRDPYVLHNSLLDWQASFAMGRWAAGHVGRRALIVTSLNDAGYDSVYAFRRGLSAAGGRVVGTVVTHAHEHETVRTQLRALGRLQPSFVYVLSSGDQAVEIVKACRASGLHAPLLASAFTTDEYLLRRLGSAGTGLRSFASWPTALADRDFAARFRQKSGRRADPFAVLGYDTGLLVAAGARRAVKRRLGIRRLLEPLHGSPVDGLRGSLTVDPRTNTVLAPLFLRQVRRLPTGQANVVLGKAPAVGGFPHALAPLADETGSGYINEYLCT